MRVESLPGTEEEKQNILLERAVSTHPAQKPRNTRCTSRMDPSVVCATSKGGGINERQEKVPLEKCSK